MIVKYGNDDRFQGEMNFNDQQLLEVDMDDMDLEIELDDSD